MAPRCFLAALLLAATAAHGQVYRPCESQRNTLELNDCAKIEFDSAEQLLNQAYRQVLDAMPKQAEDGVDYPAARRLLVQGQRAWVAFRKNDCEAIYKVNENGSIRNVRYHGCMTERTLQRIKELKAWNAP